MIRKTINVYLGYPHVGFHVDSGFIFIDKSAVSYVSKQSCSSLFQNDDSHLKD